MLLMEDVQLLIRYVKQNLSFQLNTHALPDEYYYQSLTLSAIDAVFSAQARYPSVRSVVQRYCNKYNLTTIREPRECLPLLESQENISDLIQKMEQKGVSYFAENIFENRSRTAKRLKAEILLDLLNKIQTLNIQTFQNIQPWLIHPDKQNELIKKISEISGIGQATSRYFLMLSGDDQMVKPDIMILRFIRNAIGRSVHAIEAVSLILEVSRRLLPDYSHINPRLLDYLIWSWQRNQSDPKNVDSSLRGSIEICINEQRHNSNIQRSKREKALTIPQKTQQTMHRRYQSGELLSSTQIKDDVLTDYQETPRSSVMPADYCCNKWNKSPASGIYHIFFYEKSDKKYRLLSMQDVTMPRQRGNCP